MKYSIRSLIPFLIIGQISVNLLAQPAPGLIEGKITGKIIDKQANSPLEYATVSLFTSDSALVTGTITLKDGSFLLNAGPGNYYAEVQFISYEKQIINNIKVTPQNRNIDLGTIELLPEATSLDEVTVVGERSEMVINLDKKVFNVGKDLSNTGKNALDILDNIPSVAVDMDGNITLRGSGNIQILIDGKPSGMLSGGNTNALQTLQGSMIEKVEIITNPSARYQAEGMAGIINIVLRKDANKGLHGTFEGTIGYPEEYSLGANINYRNNKINYFVNYNTRYSERPGGGYSYQRFSLPDTSYITRIERDQLRTGYSNRLRGGFDYFINDKNTITTAFHIGLSNRLNTSHVRYMDYSLSELLLGDTLRTDVENDNRYDMEFSLNYEKKFDKDEHKFTFIAQYENDNDIEKSSIDEVAIIEDVIVDTTRYQQSNNEEGEWNLLLQADYVYPFGNEGKFETGLRSEMRKIHNPYLVEERDSVNPEIWNILPEYSNTFDYTENIHAFYIQGGNNFGNFGIQIGLRTELSNVITHLYETNEKNERTYLDFFPTLHTTYQFNHVHSLQLSYSRRIQRPRFWYLNPFYSYTDSRNRRSGNPNLNPEYTHSFETGYVANIESFNFYSGVYYRYSTDVMERVSQLIDSTNINVSFPLNLSDRQSYGVESNVTLRIKKWLTFNTSFDFYRSITDGNYQGRNLHSDDYSWNTRMNARLNLPKDIDFQAIFFYRAPQETTQGLRKAFYMLNMGISKDVLDKNGTITFNISDVLNSRKFRYIENRPELYSENEFRWSKPNYRLTFVYRLNQKKRMGRNGNNENEGGGGDFGGEDMSF